MAQQRVLPYRYKPLPDQRSIRLFELHRGSGVEGLRCSTKIVWLENPPSYAALSYTWGSPFPDGLEPEPFTTEDFLEAR